MRNVWKYVHRSNAHTQNRPNNLRRSVCGGCRPLITSARISTPFPSSPIALRRHPLASLPPPHPSRSFLSPSSLLAHIPLGFSFTFHQRRRRWRLRTSPPISLGQAFSRFFSFRVYLTPFPFLDRGSRRWGRRRVSRGCNHRHRDPASSV